MPRVLCFGSVNVDDVFVVPHIVNTGETISSSQYKVHAGGKGANQSVALARAGVHVQHAGRIGKDGEWVAELMRKNGVKTDYLTVDEHKPNGRAIIQVSSADNDNAIVLLPGTNHAITSEDADKAVAAFQKGDWLILQNEINMDAANHVAQRAAEKGMVVVVNPAPCPSDYLKQFKLEHADVLVVNASEAASVAAQMDTAHMEKNTGTSELEVGQHAAELLLARLPKLKLALVTLGGDGAVACTRSSSGETKNIHVPALKGVRVVDTTGAGDTFVGYFTASLVKELEKRSAAPTTDAVLNEEEVIRTALKFGTTAGGIACETEGAMPSIPLWEGVLSRTTQK
ncbi:Ribokinase-like protein [Phlyctochytrium arcticum]|nr:Ribokinase-like protein [Phlyctochytrium arcticum]